MLQVKCIKKFRDKSNKIYGYRLKDIDGQTKDVTPKDLKEAIINNQILVSNLRLTSDNRLVNTSVKQLENTDMFKNKPTNDTIESNRIKEICDYLGFKFDSSRIEAGDGIVEYWSPNEIIFGADYCLSIGINNNGGHVYLESDDCEIIADTRKDDIQRQSEYIRELLIKLRKPVEYYKENMGKYLDVIEVLSSYASEAEELMMIPLIARYATSLGIYNEVVKYLMNIKNKLLSNTKFIDMANKLVKRLNTESSAYGYEISEICLEDIILYCTVYRVDLRRHIPDAMSIDMLRSENVLGI